MSRARNTFIHGLDHIDQDYYLRARSERNMYRFDYHLSRVTNNPDFTNKSLLDLHGQIETHQSKKYSYNFDESSKPTYNVSAGLLIRSIILKFDEMEYSERDRSLVQCGIIWYLMSTNLLEHAFMDEIPTEMIDIADKLYLMTAERNLNYVEFIDLISLCGSRFSAEKSRRLTQELVLSLK